MFNPTRITRSIAIAFGALAAALCAYVPVATAMPVDPVAATPAVVKAGIATQHIANEATQYRGGPTLVPFGGSDASQVAALPSVDRSDAAQRSPVEHPA